MCFWNKLHYYTARLACDWTTLSSVSHVSKRIWRSGLSIIRDITHDIKQWCYSGGSGWRRIPIILCVVIETIDVLMSNSLFIVVVRFNAKFPDQIHPLRVYLWNSTPPSIERFNWHTFSINLSVLYILVYCLLTCSCQEYNCKSDNMKLNNNHTLLQMKKTTCIFRTFQQLHTS
jgi:hypothetical protein